MRYTILILSLLIIACSEKQEKKAPVYKVAYNVLVDPETDNYDVFIMGLDGSDPQNITNWPGVEWSYYAYEDDIFFISDKDSSNRYFRLHKMKPDGSGKMRISEIRLADSWQSGRKSGNELAVKPHRSVDSVLYIINMEGEIVRKLETGFPYFGDPLFSPDGSQLVFRGAPEPFKRNVRLRDELYIMNADGSDIRQLTQYPETDTTAFWHSYKAGPPRWNSKDNFITYQSFRDGKYSLFAVTPDGEKHWKLTENEQSEGWHDWSPDGRYLAIELFDQDQTQFHIGIMDWETKTLEIITDTTYTYQQAPVFVSVNED